MTAGAAQGDVRMQRPRRVAAAAKEDGQLSWSISGETAQGDVQMRRASLVAAIAKRRATNGQVGDRQGEKKVSEKTGLVVEETAATRRCGCQGGRSAL